MPTYMATAAVDVEVAVGIPGITRVMVGAVAMTMEKTRGSGSGGGGSITARGGNGDARDGGGTSDRYGGGWRTCKCGGAKFTGADEALEEASGAGGTDLLRVFLLD